MFLKHSTIAPARVSDILKAAETACRAIPPAFPLSATVAVNPFLGQTGEPLTMAAARLARVAGVRLTRSREEYAAAIAKGTISDDDLAAALFESTDPLKPVDLAALKSRMKRPHPAPQALPTVAELAAQAEGTDWPALILRATGLWAAGHFDEGQALWTPAPGRPAFAAWRDWATNDLTPEIAGLTGFCAHVADAPDTAERAILRACETLGITDEAAETVFHRLLVDLGGWAHHARWQLWQAELAGGSDTALTDLLAIRLLWEEALFHHVPAIAPDWEATIAAHAAPIAPTPDEVADAILQDAAERAHQRGLEITLKGGTTSDARPALQAAFCIDVRSEVFRRALESTGTDVETIGFAGFFGLPVAHSAHGSDLQEAHLPVLLQPAVQATSHRPPEAEQDARISARAARAWGRFRQAAVSSFAFVEAAGPFYGAKLVKDALGRGAKTATHPAPRFATELSPEDKAATAAKVLRAMSFTRNHARLVLLLGHGADVANNPHESAYHCGACGGQTGEVSARLLASLLNDPETRAGLPGHGIDLPADTLFVAGLHETTTDAVTLYADDAGPDHGDDLKRARLALDTAGALARAERAARLPGAKPETVAARARNWAEIRPEWGLAGCAAFIAAPRPATAGVDLGGRAFLHNYDWQADEGFGTLELILTAPVVVASWISLQYYGSSVAPEAFGGGNKLIHNVTGGIGVVQGNGGRLRTGLPWQAVHDGDGFAHEPLRLSVMIEAPEAAILDILARHDGVRELFDNGWLHLFTLKEGRVAARYKPGGTFKRAAAETLAA
ncbi:hypothetical protein FIU97_06860 [Roseivivax sp. THAF40]|uniref:YbcC family protein n=1 Tax=unclassified Roseivivax TaxID=2639302 RepID=UPI001268E817|nr:MULTISPECIES: DUF2309 domain-containing protein [unclassified Roseivivax]QFS82524.1 hypothetical protein FIV09_06760 [Roseivivax sp. THAF197b]QFT46293.1 hypothetical protein FIU97_06860 [Roseivivax sp. THAF40]